MNKERVVSLAVNDFVCLVDSDNFVPESYFRAWNVYIGDSPPDNHTMYIPVRTIPQANHPGFDYSQFSGKTYTKQTFKELFRTGNGSTACNTGNYIVPKKFYLDSRPHPTIEHYIPLSSALDVLFKNFNIWENGGSVVFVPGMEYHHIVHPGSFYTQSAGVINHRLFDSLYA